MAAIGVPHRTFGAQPVALGAPPHPSLVHLVGVAGAAAHARSVVGHHKVIWKKNNDYQKREIVCLTHLSAGLMAPQQAQVRTKQRQTTHTVVALTRSPKLNHFLIGLSLNSKGDRSYRMFNRATVSAIQIESHSQTRA